MRIRNVNLLSVALIVLVMLCGCANDLHITTPKGEKGDPGKSAFEIWKEYYGKDDSTTIEDFINALKGNDGTDGVTGSSSYELWVQAINGEFDPGYVILNENGEKWTKEKDGTKFSDYMRWIKGKNGTAGQDGSDGTDGESIYDQWLDLPENQGKDESQLTYDIFLEWLNNQTVTNGVNGSNGKSAYEIWKQLPGNEHKTIEEFIAYLKGQNGLSSYEIWRNAVKDADITVLNNDGSIYDYVASPDNTTIGHYLAWLLGPSNQSGYKYWLQLYHDGDLKDKNGNAYTGGTSELDYFEWLRGTGSGAGAGNQFSILVKYWLSTGNDPVKSQDDYIPTDQDMADFISLMTTCNCLNEIEDLIKSSLRMSIYEESIKGIELTASGDIAAEVNTILSFYGPVNTTIKIKRVDGSIPPIEKIIKTDTPNSEVTHPIKREVGDVDYDVTMTYKDKVNTKRVTVKGLNIIQFSTDRKFDPAKNKEVITITLINFNGDIEQVKKNITYGGRVPENITNDGNKIKFFNSFIDGSSTLKIVTPKQEATGTVTPEDGPSSYSFFILNSIPDNVLVEAEDLTQEEKGKYNPDFFYKLKISTEVELSNLTVEQTTNSFSKDIANRQHTIENNRTVYRIILPKIYEENSTIKNENEDIVVIRSIRTDGKSTVTEWPKRVSNVVTTEDQNTIYMVEDKVRDILTFTNDATDVNKPVDFDEIKDVRFKLRYNLTDAVSSALKFDITDVKISHRGELEDARPRDGYKNAKFMDGEYTTKLSYENNEDSGVYRKQVPMTGTFRTTTPMDSEFTIEMTDKLDASEMYKIPIKLSTISNTIALQAVSTFKTQIEILSVDVVNKTAQIKINAQEVPDNLEAIQVAFNYAPDKNFSTNRPKHPNKLTDDTVVDVIVELKAQDNWKIEEITEYDNLIKRLNMGSVTAAQTKVLLSVSGSAEIIADTTTITYSN